MIWKEAISQFVKQKHPISYLFVGTALQKLGFRASKEYVSRNVIFIGLVQDVNRHVSISDKNWRKSIAFPP